MAQKVQTVMALAMVAGVTNASRKGVKTGRLGRNVLTNAARGMGTVPLEKVGTLMLERKRALHDLHLVGMDRRDPMVQENYFNMTAETA